MAAVGLGGGPWRCLPGSLQWRAYAAICWRILVRGKAQILHCIMLDCMNDLKGEEDTLGEVARRLAFWSITSTLSQIQGVSHQQGSTSTVVKPPSPLLG